MGVMVVTYMTVGEKIRAIRKKKKVTQKELAEKSGLSVRSIQDFEYGKIKPKLETLLKIALVLEVSPYEIDESIDMLNLWNTNTDIELLSRKVKQLDDNPSQLDILISIRDEYGDMVASTIENFLFLNTDGQQKASEYIDLLMQKYKK